MEKCSCRQEVDEKLSWYVGCRSGFKVNACFFAVQVAVRVIRCRAYAGHSMSKWRYVIGVDHWGQIGVG